MVYSNWGGVKTMLKTVGGQWKAKTQRKKGE